jgi:hypothetical protein
LGIIPAKTGRTTYPDVPEHLARHFWRGVVDGDGWLTWAKSGKRRQLILGITGDQPLVEAFQAFCQQHVPTRATIQPNGNKVVKFVVTDWFAYRIAEILYDDGHTALSRKQRVFFRAKKILAGKEWPVRNWLARLKEISA